MFGSRDHTSPASASCRYAFGTALLLSAAKVSSSRTSKLRMLQLKTPLRGKAQGSAILQWVERNLFRIRQTNPCR